MITNVLTPDALATGFGTERTRAVAADVTTEDAVRATIGTAVDRLVSKAGLSSGADFGKMPLAD